MKLDYELELQRVATESANAILKRRKNKSAQYTAAPANKYNHNIENKHENTSIYTYLNWMSTKRKIK